METVHTRCPNFMTARRPREGGGRCVRREYEYWHYFWGKFAKVAVSDIQEQLCIACCLTWHPIAWTHHAMQSAACSLMQVVVSCVRATPHPRANHVGAGSKRTRGRGYATFRCLFHSHRRSGFRVHLRHLHVRQASVPTCTSPAHSIYWVRAFPPGGTSCRHAKEDGACCAIRTPFACCGGVGRRRRAAVRCVRAAHDCSSHVQVCGVGLVQGDELWA